MPPSRCGSTSQLSKDTVISFLKIELIFLRSWLELNFFLNNMNEETLLI
jgi:hypothetical protein